MRKGISIFLFSLLCLSLFGYQFFYYLQIAEAKKEMKHYIGDLKKQQVLTTIYVNFKEQDQISWENETEFTYKHNLFDLVEKKETKDGLIIICLADKNEESLVNSFKKFNDQSYPSHTSSGSLLKLINQTFLTTETLTINRIGNKKSLLIAHHTIHLPSQLRFVLIPPPKMVI